MDLELGKLHGKSTETVDVKNGKSVKSIDFRKELLEKHKAISSTINQLVGDGDIGNKRIGLSFSDVKVSIGEQPILKGISGVATPGNVLSIMGPSGSGKTTLLNCLAGRLKCEGEVLLNGRPQKKLMKRYIAYVLQDELFFGKLTVAQILYFTAEVRLPDAMTSEQKRARADQIMALLGIAKCRNSIVGTPFMRGISGGERKRLNIAVQLITWPSLILLDEPTSGLDSSTSLDLLLTLRELAKKGCTVVTTIHQPSSSVFAQFDQLLVLAEGHTFYYGNAENVVKAFETRGFECPSNYNPGDFVLELAKSHSAKVSMFGKDGSGPVIEDSKKMLAWISAARSSVGDLKSQGSDVGLNLKSSDDDEGFTSTFVTSWDTQFKALFNRAW
eukprot:CAMPEP_0167757892 /NCGR_PEP_ID=MMETSP0110_2-20121227/10173_1 /TAXON_ID=629695 /ORGANISM="Gymnochlora sp., Strain CCMP2014" /LENGTH=386 /DNA_ID=CAMNT_0007644123 /DNA_START=8 /DNA_END=1165 /DNA_ORIENTATION=-